MAGEQGAKEFKEKDMRRISWDASPVVVSRGDVTLQATPGMGQVVE
jgi:hypothetical protein